MINIRQSLQKALAIGALLVSGVAWGWDSAGHMAVGAIADALLAGTPAARHVSQILGPDEALRQAAIWPDCVKAVDPDKRFAYVHTRYYDRQCQFFDHTQAGIQAMQDYVRRNNDNCPYDGKYQNCHKNYHFADIPLQQGHYDPAFIGASEHDVVHAMHAALRLLQGQPVPDDIHFAEGDRGKVEALRLLAHLVGDIHQPLHVGALYLTPAGEPLNPRPDEADGTSTQGGNLLQVGQSGNLHHDWDAVPRSLDAGALVAPSRAVPVSPGGAMDWPALWASESVAAAGAAYRPLRFGARSGKTWPVVFLDRKAYIAARTQMQSAQIVKAGARLAQLLQAIWPQ